MVVFFLGCRARRVNRATHVRRAVPENRGARVGLAVHADLVKCGDREALVR